MVPGTQPFVSTALSIFCFFYPLHVCLYIRECVKTELILNHGLLITGLDHLLIFIGHCNDMNCSVLRMISIKCSSLSTLRTDYIIILSCICYYDIIHFDINSYQVTFIVAPMCSCSILAPLFGLPLFIYLHECPFWRLCI